MATLVRLAVLAACVCASLAQYSESEERAPRYIASEPKPTPVPILKQINRHNEDGSYTYGYEAADGSFKIETKAATGEVKGKYGYKDDTGKLRVVEYGANKFGFQPAGEGITVAPPTLVDETKEQQHRNTKSQGGRSQYQAPSQSIDYDYEEAAPASAPRPRPAPQQYRPAPAPRPQPYRAPQAAPAPPRPVFFSGAAPVPVDQENFFNPAPQPSSRQYKPKQDFRSTPPQFSQHTQADFSQDFSQSGATRPQFAPYQQQSAPSQQQFAPSQQQFAPSHQQFAPAPRPEFDQQRGQPFSMLDQLLKEYALPEGGSRALHDISFGSY